MTLKNDGGFRPLETLLHCLVALLPLLVMRTSERIQFNGKQQSEVNFVNYL